MMSWVGRLALITVLLGATGDSPNIPSIEDRPEDKPFALVVAKEEMEKKGLVYVRTLARLNQLDRSHMQLSRLKEDNKNRPDDYQYSIMKTFLYIIESNEYPYGSKSWAIKYFHWAKPFDYKKPRSNIVNPSIGSLLLTKEQKDVLLENYFKALVKFYEDNNNRPSFTYAFKFFVSTLKDNEHIQAHHELIPQEVVDVFRSIFLSDREELVPLWLDAGLFLISYGDQRTTEIIVNEMLNPEDMEKIEDMHTDMLPFLLYAEDIIRYSQDPKQAEKLLWEAICTSVEKHLIADVPVGLFLSGGLDSSLVAVACAEMGRSQAYAGVC